ncbi:aminotransferase class III-fold pyridoxal phosphate-dependent enzyme [Nocardia sp. CDC159]|uniref:Aminotransferase class III-fold pyridoxal phosphate-dependent enzyme n=1 Tax=Nocardia pulmonis TaxID=2951408 RepID=A0A9X2IXP3_9NOCA|nr:MULTISPECIES: aminotransferase class III-fold pyridoxal phosphate-dependent enzyme [Nocardia]MCM6775598.1 aminotransferase class III-fold pyridoxal phosphate-dependent enzyme [Nocardia pulmonis]MCM6787668.1 aminotransferase class III-fold pyridoxal phosphate-dependent enzyme [Nocardia sp. CDC159]
MSTEVAADDSQLGRAVFRGGEQVRALLAERVAATLPNMVLASSYVPPDGAVAAFLLHRVLSGGNTSGGWHSVFVNSGVEALGTVVKYLRNRHNRTGTGGRCRILVLDRTDTVRLAFGHAVPGLSEIVDDGLEILADPAEFARRVHVSWNGYVVIGDDLTSSESALVHGALARIADRDRPVAWGVLCDERALDALPAPGADIAFLGEVCVDGEMPCGAVSFTRRAFALWNNPLDSIAHISTFGANGLAMHLLCRTLIRRRPLDRHEWAAAARMRRNAFARSARLRMHGNTWQTRAIDIAGINLTFDHADGVTYRLGAREYIDLASGAGPAFRGHNAQTIATITSAGTTGGETERLERTLARLTGLPVLLPAVSGQSAVDHAILAALCCRPGRGVVVTCGGNYSGKGPLSLALSRTSSFFRDRDRHAFHPYPVEVVEVDPGDIDALRRTLRRPDIALVWLELVQAYDCTVIPDAVLREIDRGRAESGYLVGVDEVFTGFWRCDLDHFLTSAGRGLRPDLVAVSKALADGLLPIGAALISAEIDARLRRSAPEMHRWLRGHYRNDISAALAVAAIEAAEGDRAGAAAVADALETMLARAARSPVFSGYRRAGLLGRLVFSPKAIGSDPRPSVRNYAEAAVARLVAQHCGAITLQMRIAPCTAGGHSDELIDALSRVGEFLERLPRWAVDRTALRSLLGTLERELATAAMRLRESYGDRRNRMSP